MTRQDVYHNQVVEILKDRFGSARTMVGAELGVWKGELSARLLSQFPNLRLIMIDSWQANRMGDLGVTEQSMLDAKHNTEPWADRRTIIIQDIVQATKFLDELDWVYIDANHKHEFVMSDLFSIWPCMKLDGLIMGHDYDGRSDKVGRFGVKPSVDFFCERLGFEVHKGKQLVWWLEKK